MARDNTIRELAAVVGNKHVITGAKAMERFCKGYRSGEGQAVCVVRPGTLLEFWRVLQVCVAADVVIITQAANTGLTEGSTPKGSYDRGAVVINTMRMNDIHALNGGEQILSFPGATLFALERLLAPLGRLPHSVIGSSTIGASIVGGVCNNSGGSLIERGPAYTELALFAQVQADGTLQLVNHLGIDLGNTPEEILTRLQEGEYDRDHVEATNRRASDSEYRQLVRDVDAPTPSRFNADKRRLYEASGCAGKLAVFALRLDTFPKSKAEKVFYIGTNDTHVLTKLRRHMLKNFQNLPVSAEYLHREAYDLSETYGKDTVLMIKYLGTDRLPMFFALKGIMDARLNKLPILPKYLTDHVMQVIAKIWPNILPERMRDFHKRYEHHLMLKMRDDGIEEAEAYVNALFEEEDGEVFTCTDKEAKIAGLHRFAAAGAAVRYHNVHGEKTEDILSLDVALRRNEEDWFEVLPPEIEQHIVHKIYYGHFFCHVLHQDYIVAKGVDVKAVKAQLLDTFEERGAEFPSEHNVGHLYPAKPDLADFYKQCDPTNTFNPGIGRMSRERNYA